MIKGLIIPGVMLIFLIGFWLGRRMGLKEGFERGINQAPLEIKKRSLEKGECIICGKTKNFQNFAGKL